jgi:hypothetical protein
MATRHSRRNQALRNGDVTPIAGYQTASTRRRTKNHTSSRTRKALLAARAAESQDVTTLVQALQSFGTQTLAEVA